MKSIKSLKMLRKLSLNINKSSIRLRIISNRIMTPLLKLRTKLRKNWTNSWPFSKRLSLWWLRPWWRRLPYPRTTPTKLSWPINKCCLLSNRLKLMLTRNRLLNNKRKLKMRTKRSLRLKQRPINFKRRRLLRKRRPKLILRKLRS